MSQRFDHKKWIWCCVALSFGPFFNSVNSITVKNPSVPATVEAQAKFFQDFFSVQLSPYKLEFGHVCEDPNNWEQRYEKKDYKNHRDMGKVRWGDKHGGYGEHYWDLNHAGHAGAHGNDDYSNDRDDGYNHDRDNSHDNYAEQTPSYGTEEYDSDHPQYEESGRAKRAHPRVKSERKKSHKLEEEYEEKPQNRPLKLKQRTKEQLQAEPSYNVEKYEDDEEVTKKPLKKKAQKQKVVTEAEDNESQDNQFETQKDTKDSQEQANAFVPRRQPDNQYVPYEQGAGVRQHYHPEATAAATAPRLFLEPSTGHVVDRATGQAYVLQPININNYNQ